MELHLSPKDAVKLGEVSVQHVGLFLELSKGDCFKQNVLQSPHPWGWGRRITNWNLKSNLNRKILSQKNFFSSFAFKTHFPTILYTSTLSAHILSQFRKCTIQWKGDNKKRWEPYEKIYLKAFILNQIKCGIG